MSSRSESLNQRMNSHLRATEDADEVAQAELVDSLTQLKEDDERPWYRRPSPWWILITMPLSAMALSGSGPSLLQIYTDMVCKSQYPYTDAARGQILGTFSSLLNNSWTRPSLNMLSTAYEPPPGAPDCSGDPKVQATVATLAAVLLTTQGVLSILTGASWSSLSDRVGRRQVLAISTFAMLFCYGYYLLVFYATKNVGNAFWALIIGPFVSGALGGTAVASATSTAYIADCTESVSRARVFSLTMGLRFVGMAIGPSLCSAIVEATGTPASAIIFVVVVHLFNLAAIIFIIPESLSESRQAENKRMASEISSRSSQGSADSSIRWKLSALARKAFTFVKPLAIVGPIATTTNSGRAHKDYSLTFIALSNGFASIILAQNPTLFQFAFKMYHWTAIRVGYWYSGMVAARAGTLMIFLPAIIKAYHYYTRSKSSKPSPGDDSDEETPLINATSTSASVQASSAPPHSPLFDLAIAQCSLLLEVACYTIIPLSVSPSHPGLFIALTILMSCGSGFGPAVQALTVELFNRRGGKETGRLFGVLSVIQITSSQILGPLIYGLFYSRFVATYPQGIFFVSVGASMLAVVSLFFVELPHGSDREVERSA